MSACCSNRYHSGKCTPSSAILLLVSHLLLPQAPAMLSFVLHCLTKSNQPSVHLSLLYIIPALAVDRVSAELVAGTILTLSSSSPSLYPLAVRLMCRAWERQVSSYLFPSPPSIAGGGSHYRTLSLPSCATSSPGLLLLPALPR